MRPRLCHVFPAFATGGPEVRTALLLDALSSEFQHTVVSLNGNLSGRPRVRTADDVRFLEVPGHCRGLGYLLALGRLLRSCQPGLVLTYGWGGIDAIAAARLNGFRVVHTEDGFLPDEAQGQKRRRLYARRLVLRAAARLVCPSQTLVRIARGQWWLPERQICFIPNGIDTTHFTPPTPRERAEARRRLGLSEGEILIGTVGHLRAEKNQERLIRALAGMVAPNRAHLVLVGDGELRPSLQQIVAELALAGQVIFAGLAADPRPFYHAMDIFALSSDTEQMPLALLEAMAAGLPVVSTDVGDVSAMVAPNNRRLIVSLGDEAAYRAGLDELTKEESTRAALGRANRTRCVAEYSLSGMIDAYRVLYFDNLDHATGE